MKIYMFHYVLKDFNYYHFDIDLFEKTIKKLKEKNHIISLYDFDKLYNKEEKENYVMLTFDDATIDHYKFVYPILKKYNCSGLFFIPSCVFNKKILNIQIIHKLLALDKFEEMYNFLILELNKINFDFENLKLNYTLDDNKIAAFKQLLQYKLPFDIRNNILEKLMEKYNISNNVEDYYINVDQLKKMKENGMYFGVHTVNHPNLELLSYDEQYDEINDNLNELKNSKLIDEDLISIAYPYGYYNKDTLRILNELKIKYGFKAYETKDNSILEINRIDCNILKEEINE